MTMSTAYRSSHMLRRIYDLKTQISSLDHDSLLKPDSLLSRQHLQDLCSTVLLSSLESALDQKVETDLWNYGFKAQITALQNAIRTRTTNNTKRSELQAELNMFLESALGFYSQLGNKFLPKSSNLSTCTDYFRPKVKASGRSSELPVEDLIDNKDPLFEEVCEIFHLHPPFRKKYSSFGIIQGRSEYFQRSRFRFPSRSSSSYICQYCLVHLGDIARYLQRISLAENFYNLAACYVPSNGQPFNQLAILCSTRNNKLAVTYFYIRAIAVRSPFPVAPTNLQKFYAKHVKDCENIPFVSKSKWTHADMVSLFLYFQAIVHLEADKIKAVKLGQLLHRCLGSQTIFSLLTPYNVHHMMTISIFALTHLDDTGEEKSKTEDEKHYRDVMLTFLVGFFEVLLSQAPKLNVREHVTLPSIKIILDWLIGKENYLSHDSVKSHRCWFNLAKALNAIQSHSKDTPNVDMSIWESFPLAEDVELHCFIPLNEPHRDLDFGLAHTMSVEPADVTRIRCHRLVELGKALAERYPSLNLIDYKVNAKSSKLIFTAPTAIRVDPSERKKGWGDKNVAIQAIKARDSLTSTPVPPDEPATEWTTTTHTTEENIWSNPTGLSLPDMRFPSSNDSSLTFAGLQTNNPIEFPDGDEIANSLPLQPSPPVPDGSTRRVRTQGVIGSEVSRPRVPIDNAEKMGTADSSLAPSDANSYSLFSTSLIPFDLSINVTSSMNISGTGNVSDSNEPFSSTFLTSSSFGTTPSWSLGSGGQSTSQSLWGTSSALAQLLEEQQKRQGS